MAGSVFIATGDNTLQRNTSGGTAAFTNAGTFRKQTGTGLTTINGGVTFTNSGTVDVQSGTINLAGVDRAPDRSPSRNGATLRLRWRHV